MPLTALKIPGRMEPMPMRVSVTEAFSPEEIQSLSLSLEQADIADGSWSAVPARPGAQRARNSFPARAWGPASCLKACASPGCASFSR